MELNGTKTKIAEKRFKVRVEEFGLVKVTVRVTVRKKIS